VTLAAAVCFTIALVAELAGIRLVVRNGQTAQRALREWSRPKTTPDADGPMAVLRRGNTELAHLQLEADEGVLEHVLASQARWGLAVGLLVGGAAVGALGNFLSLSW